MKKDKILLIIILISIPILLGLILLFSSIENNNKTLSQEELDILEKNSFIRITLENAIEETHIEEVKNELLKIPGIYDVKFLDSSEVAEEFKANTKNIASVFDNDDLASVFPSMFEVKYNILDLLDNENESEYNHLIEQIQKIDGVKEVQSSYKTIKEIYEHNCIIEFNKFNNLLEQERNATSKEEKDKINKELSELTLKLKLKGIN